jgi:hypothetical protein
VPPDLPVGLLQAKNQARTHNQITMIILDQRNQNPSQEAMYLQIIKRTKAIM